MIAPADVDPARCTITGTCVSSATAVAGERSILHITPLDRFGNAIRRGAGLLRFRLRWSLRLARGCRVGAAVGAGGGDQCGD